MQWDGDEMHTCADPLLVEFHDELVATDVETVQVKPECIEVPRMTAIVLVRGEFQFLDVGERPVVGLR
jgi:hypothetical protein